MYLLNARDARSKRNEGQQQHKRKRAIAAGYRYHSEKYQKFSFSQWCNTCESLALTAINIQCHYNLYPRLCGRNISVCSVERLRSEIERAFVALKCNWIFSLSSNIEILSVFYFLSTFQSFLFFSLRRNKCRFSWVWICVFTSWLFSTPGNYLARVCIYNYLYVSKLYVYLWCM